MLHIFILISIFPFFIIFTNIIFHQNQKYLISKISITPYEYLCTFYPSQIIIFPLKELSNWIPSPIPQYTPAPFHPAIKVNDLFPLTENCFNQTNPEIPTLYNILTKAVVFPNGGIVTSSYYFPSFTYYFEKIVSNPFKVELKSLEIIDQAIPIFHRYLRTYYHFIIEIIPLIFCFPKDIVENSVLIHCPFLNKQFDDICSILNIKYKKKLRLKKAVLVKKLYVPNSNIFIEFNANAVRHFRHLMIEKCNATFLKATQNVYYNRPRNRLILNFNELKTQLKNELPNVEFVQPTEKSMMAQVRFWRQTKFVMMVHGSMFSNFIFMHPNAAYLEFCIKACRSAAQKLCQSFGIHIYQMMFRNHCLNRSMYADIPDVISAVRKILEMLQTQDLSLY